MKVQIKTSVEAEFTEAEFSTVPNPGDAVVSDTYGEFVVDSVAWFLDDDNIAAPRITLVEVED